MAGAGYKLFNTGDVLTAAQVNTYLMEQSIMVFADSTARTTALSGVLAEGMVTYLKSTDVVEIYNGSAWVSLDDPNAIQNSIVDAKGDIITATADNVPARLAVGGTNGHVLTVDSSTSTGLKWAAVAGSGKVLQVVSATTSTNAVTSSTSYVDTNLTVTITPSAATSKVLILVSQMIQFYADPGAQAAGGLNLLRGATEIYEQAGTQNIGWLLQATGATKAYWGGCASMVYLDSPNTTSATTYKTQMKVSNAAYGFEAQKNSCDSSIIALEIGA